jgi:hypothetical protein
MKKNPKKTHVNRNRRKTPPHPRAGEILIQNTLQCFTVMVLYYTLLKVSILCMKKNKKKHTSIAIDTKLHRILALAKF